MQVEAIYRQGRLEFLTPLRLKQGPLRVIVEVPDEALDAAIRTEVSTGGLAGNLPSAVVAHARAKREMLDAIRNAPPPPDDELPAMSDKQCERLEALALREDR
ncbi:MAG: hypothetical protein K9L82_15440 [Chromatiaceae bacterium]|nr:hypothetical protein [Chromatiaceae bacterium]MCF7997159.1 hypothetical protein [Chromatiaceae bacterium]